jgi:alpha-beta hydrolase superfamily lysophospholipase
VDLLRFESGYVALNPLLRESYARHVNNATARAQHWRHEDGPRPTLCVVHGFGASPAWLNTAFFSLKTFFAEGWDVVLFTLPFHGSRRGDRVPLNGIELFAHGMAHFVEAMLHAVHDFRALVDHLEEQGAPRFGVTGLSLGGYTTALLAAVERRLDFAVPNAAVTWLPPLLASWFPVNLTSAPLRALTRVPEDLLYRALALHSPLTYAPVLPKDRLMIVAGLGDRLAPPDQSLLLWEHWERPELHWFPGSHVMHFGRRAYLDAMRRLIAPKIG